MEQWTRKFELLDASFCFLSKHRALLSVANVLRMANSFGSVQMAADDIEFMARVAPALLQLRNVTRREMQGKGSWLT